MLEIVTGVLIPLIEQFLPMLGTSAATTTMACLACASSQVWA